MTRARAEKLVKESNGQLCVRYAKDAGGKVITASSRKTQIRRQATAAAGALTATLMLSTFAYAQGQPGSATNKSSHDKESAFPHPSDFKDPLALSGVVQDLNGAVVPDANVTLRDLKTQRAVSRIRTDAEGRFIFNNISVGVYEIHVEFPGFKKLIYTELKINNTTNLKEPLVLEPAGDVVELMGVVGFVEEHDLIPTVPPVITSEIRPRPLDAIPSGKKSNHKKNKKKLPK
ncbi:MAG: carboxypeptidase-like regulatory domain-containing protein [Pyrinomonadaceae bacterium]